MRTSLLTPLLLSAPALGQSDALLNNAQEPFDGETTLTTLASDSMDVLRKRAIFDAEADGTIWAAGPDWKASFGQDGLEFIPFLGSDAPRNYPVRLDLSSVTVAGEALFIADEPDASRDDRVVTLDRSSLREVYHVNDDSVEQTFVFDSLPGSGEIVLRLDVETELTATDDGAGFQFWNERGGVSYGAATAIDASGAELALEQRYANGGIEIVVPADFVAASTFPLVIDPILSTNSATTDAIDQIDVDVAFDGTAGVYMLVYEEVWSMSDHDVRSIFFNTGVDLFLDPASIDVSSDNWTEPRIASSPTYSSFLTVASVGDVGGRDVFSRIRMAGSGTVLLKTQVTSMFGDNFSADVGAFGGDFATGYPYLVVFQNLSPLNSHSDIYTQSIQANGTLQAGVVAVADSVDDDVSPRISNSSGAIGLSTEFHEFLIAWERVVAPGDHDIWTRVVGYGGSVVGHDEWLSYSLSTAGNVAVSTKTYQWTGAEYEAAWVMAFERFRNGVDELYTIVAKEGTTYPARSIPVMQDLDYGVEHADPRITIDGTGDFFLTYKVAGNGGYNAYVTNINVVRDLGDLRTGVADRRRALAHAPGQAGAVAIGSTYEGAINGASDSRAMILHTSPGVGGLGDVTSTIYQELSESVEGSQFCDAADNVTGVSAFIRASESYYFPTGTLAIDVSDLPPNAWGYPLASLTTGFTANPGGSAGNLCLSGAIGRFDNLVMNSGMEGTYRAHLDLDNMPQPTGSTSVMSGERWKFQFWTRDVANGVATSNFSNGVVVHFD